MNESANAASATIVLIEDHPIFCKGLTQLIHANKEFSVVGEAANSLGAVRLVEEKKPDLVLVDLNLGDEDGLELIKNLKALFPDLLMLVLSMHDERNYSERVLRAGARGYIMKEEAGDRVVEAIKTVLAGKIWLSESERERLFDSLSGGEESGEDRGDQDSLKALSDRQLQIFSLIGKGLGTLEIAAKLGISTKTVGTHKEHIKTKMNCASLKELRQLAVRFTNL
ncbi:MAG: response regulator transcription factor [Spirochaetales bacterium]|nr:response regulator transcription factor [Spirochaetales bacterium]